MNEPEIYFHVGLGKVASTYLQNKVFNNLEGIHYIPKNKYRSSIEIIKKMGPKKYLVSCEMDRQFNDEVARFTSHFSNVKIIILFREHGGWIASQYRRYVKNGWHHNFEEFVTLDSHQQGMWDKKHLNFYSKLEVIEKHTQQKPLVLFHNELKEDPWVFFDKISQFSGTSYTKENISLSKVHTSYSEKQLLVLRFFCRNFVGYIPRGRSNRLMNWLLFRPWWAFFHLVMYVAIILPKSWIPKGSLIAPDYLKKVNDLYLDDWNKITQYAQNNNP